MPNIKISDLNRAHKLSDEALIVVVQDNSNKVISVKDLKDKVNEDQNKLIAKIYDEVKAQSPTSSLIKLKDVAIKHEYRINRAEAASSQAMKDVHTVSEGIRFINKRLDDHKKMLVKNEKDNILTRRGLAYANGRIDGVIKDLEELNDGLSEKITYLEEEITYVKGNIDDIDDFNVTSYAYLASFTHFDRKQYWEEFSIENMVGTNTDFYYPWNHRNDEPGSYSSCCCCKPDGTYVHEACTYENHAADKLMYKKPEKYLIGKDIKLS